ncbi:sugar phosphate nucleotidyltransferase [Wenyingzhuangia sp. IMCC45467]
MSENKPTLVVLAAGMGSRYGGLKQIDTFSPQGDTIIDFSIYDALQAGFEKFVFIIRKSFEKEFKEIFDKKLEGKAQVDYVYQELDAVPQKYVNPERTKPWGTGHALLMTKDVVTENFAIINADDFYGREAFQMMAKTLKETDKTSYDFSTIAYLLKNTVSEHGYVSRGECSVGENGYLTDVVERTRIETINGELKRENDNGEMIPINENTVVSMNFWGFTPKCFEFGSQLFEQFLADNTENLKAEFFLPTIVNEILKSGQASVKVLESGAKWFGVTYGEDKAMAQGEIKKLKDNHVYPIDLWA